MKSRSLIEINLPGILVTGLNADRQRRAAGDE
jgi:hypothetical protein